MTDRYRGSQRVTQMGSEAKSWEVCQTATEAESDCAIGMFLGIQRWTV